MAEFVKVASLSDLPAGTAKTVEAGGTSIALYNVDGQIHATSNTCPHRGGSLGEGVLGGVVISCPWHAFEYEVTSGRCLTNPSLQIPCYPVKLEGQDILVQV
jgi:nitrite reductase/ring-hydroxylating ferredoxin subunit